MMPDELQSTGKHGMANIQFELISPERVLFSGLVRMVVLPGAEGEMTVMPGIQPTMTMLNPGFIVATDTQGQGHRAFVAGGMAQITGDSVSVLADRALPVTELTRDHLDEEIIRLETIRDGTHNDAARRETDFAIGCLKQVRAALSFSHAT